MEISSAHNFGACTNVSCFPLVDVPWWNDLFQFIMIYLFTKKKKQKKQNHHHFVKFILIKKTLVLHHLVYQIARFLYDWLSMAHASFHQQICPIYSSYYIFINFILKYKVLHHTSLIKTRPLLEKSYKVPIRYCTTHL